MCFNLAIAGDDWASMFSGNYLSKFTVSIGRWNHYFLSKLFADRIFAPTFTFFFFVFSIGIGAIFIDKIVKFKYFVSIVLFAFIFASYPIWYEGYLFNMGRIPKAVGVLCSTAGAFLLIRILKTSDTLKTIKPLQFGAAMLLIALSAGCYQTYIYFGVFLLGVYLVESIINNPRKKILFDFATITGSIVLVGLLYVVLTRLITWIVGVEIHQGEGQYVIYNIEDSKGGPANNILGTAQLMLNYYTKSQMLIPMWLKITGLLAFLYYAFHNIREAAKNEEAKALKISLSILVILALLLLPWALGFVIGTKAFRYNSLSVLALSYAFFLVFAFDRLYNKKIVRQILLALIIGVIMTTSFINSSASFSKYISNKRDFALSEKLLSYIHESPNYSGNPAKRYKIYFVGASPYNESERPFDLQFDSKFRIKNLINIGVWDGQVGRIKHIFHIMGEPTDKFTFFPSQTKESKNMSPQFLQNNIIGNTDKIRNWPHKSSLVSLKDKNSFVVIFDKSLLE